jgi:hypothetical protein
MKKLARLAGLVSLGILAVGLMATSSASASGYLLLPVGGTITGVSLPVTLKAGSNVYNCGAANFTATIASVHLVGPFGVRFSGCTASGKTNSGCPLNSVGASGGEVITQTLHGLIGLGLPSKTPALLILPTASAEFVLLAQSTSKTTKVVCTVEQGVEGNLVGLLAQAIGTKTTRALLKFVPGDPEKIDLPLGGTVTPELALFGAPGTFETLVHLSYGQETELMP